MKKLLTFMVGVLCTILPIQALKNDFFEGDENIFPYELPTRRPETWASGEDFQKVSRLITQKYLLNTTAASGTMLDLTTSGRYYLADDMTVDPQNNNVTCIKISASNTTLDMRGFSLTSTRTNSATGTIGIEVAANLYNVKIMNGMLGGMDGTGIKINSGSTGVMIDEMVVDNCTLVGITVGNSCNNFTMKNSTVTRCDGTHASATDGAVGFKIASCELIKVENCHFDLNQHGSAGNAAGVYANACTHASFHNCTAHSNKAGSTTGNTTYGFRFDGSGNYLHLDHCEASHNTSQDGKVYGFYVDAATNGGEIHQCHADANIATGDDSHGFSFSSSSNNMYLCDCRAHSNSGNSHVYGFKFNASQYLVAHHCYSAGQATTGTSKNVYGYYSTGGTGNTFQECQAFGNKASASGAATGAGFCLAGSEQYSNILKCQSKTNSGGAGTGYGIWLDSATSCTIHGNEVFVNTGTTDGYGIKDDESSSVSAYMENFAYGNGSADGIKINNYDVNLSPNDTANVFPVREAFLTDHTRLDTIHQLDNIELIERTDVTTLRA